MCQSQPWETIEPIFQGRNEVYGVRDQGPKKGWDPGSQLRDLGSRTPGSGSAVFFIGSRITRSGSTKFCGIKIHITFGTIDCKTVVFGRFRKAQSTVSVILACEAREPHTPVWRVRRENDCRLFMHSRPQRLRSIWPAPWIETSGRLQSVLATDWSDSKTIKRTLNRKRNFVMKHGGKDTNKANFCCNVRLPYLQRKYCKQKQSVWFIWREGY